MEWYNILILLGGLFIIVVGWKKLLGIKIKSKAVALVGGFIVIGLGFYGIQNLEDLVDFEEEVPAGQVIECATFEITPTATTNINLNSAKDTFTVTACANTTAHTLKQGDNSTAWASPVATFRVEPDAYVGADADDLAKVKYEVFDSEIAVDTTTATYKLFTKSGGHRQVIWGGSGTEYVDGSHTMLMTSSVNLTLTLTVNQDSMSRMENVLDTQTVYVRFYTDCGWTETFAVDFMLLSQCT
jgi:hypothetical protein